MLREAEGYLELGMPRRALDVLERLGSPGTFEGRVLYLTGEALRELGRWGEAIEPLEQSAEIRPSNIDVWLALGWCYKRTGRLDRAVDALQRALDVDGQSAMIHYNLACYLSLLNQKSDAISHLAQALAIDPDYRLLIAEESDFNPLRDDPDFQALTRIVV